MSMIIGRRNRGFTPSVGPISISTDSLLNFNFTVVAKYLAGAIVQTGNTVRLTLSGPLTAGHSATITAVYIGHIATSGNAYDFDGNQAQVTFGGSGSVTLGPNETKVSDEITFTISAAKALLIAYNQSTGTYFPYKNGLGTNYLYYAKPSVSQASTTVKDSTGYSSLGGVSPYLRLLEAKS